MNILAINTSSIMADLCLQTENTNYCIKKDSSAKHSESVMLEIDNILSAHNLKAKQLDAIAVVIGPGSFTGIRIGVSIAKGFEMAKPSLKLIEITSFNLMNSQAKQNQIAKGEYACVINALSGKFYVQHFENGVAVSEPLLVEGTSSFENKPTICLTEENLAFATHQITIEPQTLLDFAVEKAANKQFASQLVPLYLRKSQAEDQLEGK
jgi:tRNA threonylcarbamoyl adenosine modification protein YeaZ